MMTELKGAEPITFDFHAAERLAARFTATAELLRAQIPRRFGLARVARNDWRGIYEEKFVQRMQVCAQDAERLAAAMDKAAAQVNELARLAKEERDRRAKAREWKRRHDEWKRRQAQKDWLDHGVDVFRGDGEPIPPQLTPTAPPALPPLTAPTPGKPD